VCCQQCAAVSACWRTTRRFVAVARARLLTRRSMAVCQQCVQCVSVLFCSVVCRLLGSSDAAHYRLSETGFSCSAWGVHTLLCRFMWQSAAPKTRHEATHVRTLVHVFVQSSGAGLCAGLVVLAEPAS
jgi:hypothetical protein